MQYYLTNNELTRMITGLKAAISIPFIDDIEDYILEALWEYCKNINGPDPFYNIRSKRLFDVVDTSTNIGWSVKSIQWPFYDGCQFELVIQRADVFKKAEELGFPALSKNSDPNLIGSALLKHWQLKIDTDAFTQHVISRRIMILLKSNDKQSFAILEEDIKQYLPHELTWEWTNSNKNGLQAFRKSDGMCVYRWYPSQKQFFERFILPASSQKINIKPLRLTKAQVIDILLPYLEGHQ